MPAEREVKVKISVEVKGLADLKKTEKILDKFGKKVSASAEKTIKKTTQIGKSFKGMSDNVVKTTKGATASVTKLGVSTTKASGDVKKGFKDMGYQLTFIAWHFRYLGNIISRFTQQWIRMAKDWVQTAADIEEALFGVQVASAIFGREAGKATDLVTELAETGLIQFKDAAESVRNLMMTGLGMEEVTETMWNLLSMSALYTMAGKDLGESIRKTSEATLIGTGLMRSDLMMRSLLNKVSKEANKTYDETWSSMSSVQRAQLLYNETQKMSIRTGELWRGEAALMAGQIYKLQTNIQLTKRALGDALRPVLLLTTELMSKLRTIVEVLTGKFSALISVVTILGAAFGVLTGALLVGGGVALSVVKIFKGMRSTGLANIAMLGIFKLAAWKVIIVLGAVAAAITVVTYAYLKFTGKLDAWKNTARATAEQTEDLKKRLEELGAITEEAEESDEDRRIAHERKVADIEEDLDREVSKGLWANQMNIKNLKKRLRREDEDWKRYQKGKAKGEEAGTVVFKTELEKRLDRYKEQLELLRKLGDENIKALKWGWSTFVNDISSPEFWAKWFKMWREMPGKIWVFLSETLPDLAYKLDKWLGELFSKIWKRMLEGVSVMIEIGKAWARGLVEGFLPELKGLEESYKVLGELEWARVEQLKKGKRPLEEQREIMQEMIESEKEISRGLEEMMTQSFWGYAKELLLPKWKGAKYHLEYFFEGLFKQFGGIVPGKIGQPVPIIAHGGERIVPSREPAGGNITININNPVVRSDRDIREIARQVSQAMGQRQKFAKLGAF